MSTSKATVPRPASQEPAESDASDCLPPTVDSELREAHRRYALGRLLLTDDKSPDWQLWWDSLQPDEQLDTAKSLAIIAANAALRMAEKDKGQAEEYLRGIAADWMVAQVPATLYDNV